MSSHFVIENGMLVQKLFVGPLPAEPVKEKRSSIANVLLEYENVSETVLIHNNLKEQQIAQASSLDKPEVVERASKKHRQVRRRVFHYSNVAEIMNKGYWNREKRSLTKYASNSLMKEFYDAQSIDGPKTNWKTGVANSGNNTTSHFIRRVIRIPANHK